MWPGAELGGGAQRGLLDPEELGGGPAGAVLAAGDQPDGVPAGQDPVGGGLEGGAVHRGAGGQGLTQRLEQVAAVEPGGLRRQARGAEQVRREAGDRRRRRRASAAQGGGDQLRGLVSECAGRGGPPRPQRRLRLRDGFGGPGREAGGLRGVRPRRAGRGHGGHDLLPPRREGREEVGREAGDLGDPLHRHGPGDPETCGELGAQHRVVQVAAGERVPVDGLRVDRGPPAVRAVQQVRHHQVGVQLRVPRPRGVVLEAGDDPPVGVDVGGALPAALMPAQPVPGHRLQIVDHLPDGDLVGVPDRGRHCLVAEPEQHAHRLGGGDGDVGPGPAHVHPPAGELQRGRVPVGAVRAPVHPAHVHTGGLRELPGPLRGHRGWPAAAGPLDPGRQPGEERALGGVGEQLPGRHRLGRGAVLHGVDQRLGVQPAARVRADHRRRRHPLRAGRLPREQVPQGLGTGRVDPAVQPGRRGAGAVPPPGRFRVQVVVRGAVRLPGQVVAGRVRPRAEHVHRHHHRRSPAPREDG